jgi:hypothetical protein
MTRGHGWSLAFTMWRTCTSYFLPAFTGAFCEAINFCLPCKHNFLPNIIA